MFTGIIETTGIISDIRATGTNLTFLISSSLSTSFKIDQSVSHNGVCLTVEAVRDGEHEVTAIAETLEKTNLGSWKPGTVVNIEQCMQMNGRLDGHIVQGHVDTVATCISRTDLQGSWEFRFEIAPEFAGLIIEKGSISINGISLTIFDVTRTNFTVAIIPYTFEHTNMQALQTGDLVNIEFDIIGKYINRMQQLQQTSINN
ncbi:MAG: riboflavin synthase alpha chain [Ferruginibacter sp.]|nr:riboflavin synthase alpha chain [Ferruginibacter sp.]